MRSLITALVLTWFTSTVHGLAQELPQSFPDLPPKRLHVLVSCVFGNEAGFDLKEGVLTFYAKGLDKGTQQISIHPSREAWRKFVQVLNDIKMYAWSPQYTKVNVLDGGGWRVDLAIGSREFDSKGINAYPNDDAVYLPAKEANPSRSFMRFWTALCELVGEDFKNHPLK